MDQTFGIPIVVSGYGGVCQLDLYMYVMGKLPPRFRKCLVLVAHVGLLLLLILAALGILSWNAVTVGLAIGAVGGQLLVSVIELIFPKESARGKQAVAVGVALEFFLGLLIWVLVLYAMIATRSG